MSFPTHLSYIYNCFAWCIFMFVVEFWNLYLQAPKSIYIFLMIVGCRIVLKWIDPLSLIGGCINKSIGTISWPEMQVVSTNIWMADFPKCVHYTRGVGLGVSLLDWRRSWFRHNFLENIFRGPKCIYTKT